MARLHWPRGNWRWLMPLTLLCVCLSGRAESAAESSVKAGFILNFAKFTEWPATQPDNAPLRICALGVDPLAGNLQLLDGRQAQGREIHTRSPAAPPEWHGCHVLFVPQAEHSAFDAVLRSIGDAPVLTIGDSAGFVEAGGVIGLKLRAGRLRFDINLAAAKRAGLTISSQLLRLADEVIQ